MKSSLRFAASESSPKDVSLRPARCRAWPEAVLTEAIQQYSSSLDDDGSGWLRGRRSYIGRALTLIHQNLAAPWSNETLASEVALSRSAFVDRFTSIVGLPPIRYLTLWRLQTAKLNLRETRRTSRNLRIRSATNSEEAFSRAFKREFGCRRRSGERSRRRSTRLEVATRMQPHEHRQQDDDEQHREDADHHRQRQLGRQA